MYRIKVFIGSKSPTHVCFAFENKLTASNCLPPFHLQLSKYAYILLQQPPLEVQKNVCYAEFRNIANLEMLASLREMRASFPICVKPASSLFCVVL